MNWHIDAGKADKALPMLYAATVEVSLDTWMRFRVIILGVIFSDVYDNELAIVSTLSEHGASPWRSRRCNRLQSP
jgi:hypothetical protein